MRPLYTLAQLRAIEAGHAGLMSVAGAAAAAWIEQRFPRASAILLLAGPGNNGGDAYATALHLQLLGYAPQVVDCSPPDSQYAADALQARSHWLDAGGEILDELPEHDPHLIVDGLLGIGVNRAPTGFMAQVIRWVNASDCPVLALDCPSGLNAFTGLAFAPCIEADWTLTFIGLKPGLLTGRDAACCGQLFVDDLGLADALPDADGHSLSLHDVLPLLPRRDRASHKGSSGTVGVIGGASGMCGAALLAGRAALYAGAGRVYAGLLDRQLAVDPVQPELMLRAASELFALDQLDALAIGPGLGLDSAALQTLDWALRSPLPLVIDADALTLLGQYSGLQRVIRERSSPVLLTPHPGEAARLLQVDSATIEADRIASACQLARDYGCAVVLKGSGSVIAFADGEYLINTTGNPGMAAAGQGDVLTGLLVSLLGQGMAAGDALLAGVCLHGAAADLLVSEGCGPIGLTASETAQALRRVRNQ